MQPIIECVPNFSEGRDLAVVGCTICRAPRPGTTGLRHRNHPLRTSLGVSDGIFGKKQQDFINLSPAVILSSVLTHII